MVPRDGTLAEPVRLANGRKEAENLPGLGCSRPRRDKSREGREAMADAVGLLFYILMNGLGGGVAQRKETGRMKREAIWTCLVAANVVMVDLILIIIIDALGVLHVDVNLSKPVYLEKGHVGISKTEGVYCTSGAESAELAA